MVLKTEIAGSLTNESYRDAGEIRDTERVSYDRAKDEDIRRFELVRLKRVCTLRDE